MTDWTTISSLATAGGTLVLAIATFGSVRSANRAARTAEVSLLANIRPVLIPSREDDPSERIFFGEGHRVELPGHGGVVDCSDGNVYMAVSLRNAGSGLGVLHGWFAHPFDFGSPAERPDLERFHRQQLDLYIPAGDYGYWQGAVRDESDEQYEGLAEAARSGGRIAVDLLFGDHEGGQRAVARFAITLDEDGSTRRANVIRYWNIDRDDPR